MGDSDGGGGDVNYIKSLALRLKYAFLWQAWGWAFVLYRWGFWFFNWRIEGRWFRVSLIGRSGTVCRRFGG